MPDAEALDTFERLEAPAPTPAVGPLTRPEMLLAMRRNMLALYGRDAFRQMTMAGPFFGQRSVFTNDPVGIKRVLVENSENYTRTPATFRILRPMLGEGLFLSEGEQWRFQRRTLAPAFTPRAMRIVARTTAEVLDQEVRRLKAEAVGAFDLMPMIQRLAIEVAGRAMFSTAMERRGPQLRKLFETYGRDYGAPFPSDILLPASVPGPAELIRRRQGRRWLDFIQAMVETRKRMPREGARRDLFDLMAEARDPETGRGFELDELRDQFATFIIAGHETTALTVLWAFIMLARAPRLQAAVAREAATRDLSAEGAPDAVADLPLTRAVVDESLRLFPPAFLIVREARGDDEVAGEKVAAGDLVSIAPWVLHRHEAYWDQPNVFDPTRFLPAAKAPAKYTYMPFGAGPRVCIGAQFALTEATLAVARTLRDVELRIVDDVAIEPLAVVTTYPNPIPLFEVRPR
ncbi:MAG: cytochrome P450 [Alphaproteobacteria bacterium]